MDGRIKVGREGKGRGGWNGHEGEEGSGRQAVHASCIHQASCMDRWVDERGGKGMVGVGSGGGGNPSG